ncbi:MAG: C45 family autoproteolytic acyltransferase/hydrolase [Acidobacteriota bacterium]
MPKEHSYRLNGRKSLLGLLAFFLLTVSVAAAAASPLTAQQKGWLSKAWSFKKNGWTYVHIEGTPQERGFQYGYLLAPEIAEGMKGDKVTWTYDTAMSWKWLVKKASAMYDGAVGDEYLAELGGIAEGMTAAGHPVTRGDMVTYNAMYELMWYWWPNERKEIGKAKGTQPRMDACSSFIATGSMTKDGGIVLGHNSMQSFAYPLPNVIIDIKPDKGHRILMQTYPGWIHSGTDFFITDAGLVGSETTIGGFTDYKAGGIPEFVRVRRAMQYADSIQQWCDIMKKGNNGGYANAWLLGNVNNGKIARLELGRKYVGFQEKADGYFTGSNVAVTPKILRWETDEHETDIRFSSVARRVRWHQLMKQYAGKIDLYLARRFEGDHYDTYLNKVQPDSRSLGARYDLDPNPAFGSPFEPSGAVDGKVVDSAMAKKMSIMVRFGDPSGLPFDASKFLEEHPQFGWMKDILPDRPSEPWTVFTAGEKK